MNIEHLDSDFFQKKLKLTPEAATVKSVSRVGRGKGLIGSVYSIKTVGGNYIAKLSPGTDSVWHAYLAKMQPFMREVKAYEFLSHGAQLPDGIIPECFWARYDD